jgi:starch phosphorylase
VAPFSEFPYNAAFRGLALRASGPCILPRVLAARKNDVLIATGASMASATVYSLEVNPRIPERLARLRELAGNLWYSWDRPTRALFARLNPALWDALAHSPKAMLKRVDEQRLLEAASDEDYLALYARVLAAYDAHMAQPLFSYGEDLFQSDDLVAYFCAEFGLHESLPIYSGGLGILSGDHCKAASEHRLAFVAVGLLYRQGYFIQKIDGDGNQRAEYFDSDFDNLPIVPVRKEDGTDLMVSVAMPGRDVATRVWQAQAGRVRLYLLDTDAPGNSDRDRGITHRLYGGDGLTRLEQEIVLGTGGVRALAAMGLRPTVWHLNEGHPAFAILERMRALVAEGLSFEAATEAVAANTVFTTHTAVSAGHDHFPDAMIGPWLRRYCQELGVEPERVASLARPPTGGDFNMTALAVRGSRFHNGVSRIHGRVSARMLREHWPQVPEEENPVGHITNGVHIPTFLSPEWSEVFERFLGNGWLLHLDDPGMAERIAAIPDHVFWRTRASLKKQMLHMLRHRVRLQHLRNHGTELGLERVLRYVDPERPDVLTIGFARRFATYKRAQLLFDDLDGLRRMFGNAQRPLLFIFAGKAHPADEPGQDLIRSIARVAKIPDFVGKILLLEGYELHVARRLVTGVDVWLNNPVFPMEASGTSGMKAGMNGVLNLSILDGWWAEGYDGSNGWAIQPASGSVTPERRDHDEAQALYRILEEELIPLYYDRDGQGYSSGWLRMAKRSMATLMPRYNATRMLHEYMSKFYANAARQGRRYAQDGYAGARAVSAWKAKVRDTWHGVSARRVDASPRRIEYGSSIRVEVAVQLNGFAPEEIAVEVLLGRETTQPLASYELSPVPGPAGEQRYAADVRPQMCGRLEYRVRLYPRHPLPGHRFEQGLMLWV